MFYLFLESKKYIFLYYVVGLYLLINSKIGERQDILRGTGNQQVLRSDTIPATTRLLGLPDFRILQRENARGVSDLPNL